MKLASKDRVTPLSLHTIQSKQSGALNACELIARLLAAKMASLEKARREMSMSLAVERGIRPRYAPLGFWVQIFEACGLPGSVDIRQCNCEGALWQNQLRREDRARRASVTHEHWFWPPMGPWMYAHLSRIMGKLSHHSVICLFQPHMHKPHLHCAFPAWRSWQAA